MLALTQQLARDASAMLSPRWDIVAIFALLAPAATSHFCAFMLDRASRYRLNRDHTAAVDTIRPVDRVRAVIRRTCRVLTPVLLLLSLPFAIAYFEAMQSSGSRRWIGATGLLPWLVCAIFGFLALGTMWFWSVRESLADRAGRARSRPSRTII